LRCTINVARRAACGKAANATDSVKPNPLGLR